LTEFQNEKTIISQTPDFDEQRKILLEEQKVTQKNKRAYYLFGTTLLLFVLIFFVSYSSIYVYRHYDGHGNNSCENVNIKTDGSLVPNINITDGHGCVPKYNIDYFNNRKPIFNVDLYGDRSNIFNKTNQMDESGRYCKINCDANKDGWPDYNLDINGDGVADLNIILDPNKKKGCDLNCDVNHDMIPDTNIDIDGDNKPDINITKEDDTKPKYNIDYENNRKPTFNIIDEDGNILNEVIDVKENPNCTKNCDIDKDGWPDYNIDINGDGTKIINELIKKGNEDVPFWNRKYFDYSCLLDGDYKDCKNNVRTNDNTYINIDTNGDGIPDVNVSGDNGVTLENEIGKEVIIDGKRVSLNEDINKDGFPDINIDTDNDNIPDLNVTDDKKVCIKNCDTNGDGRPDDLIDVGDPDNLLTRDDLNIDYNFDGKCDVNCDLNNDFYPDINIDVDGDIVPDLNIDFDHDNIADYNIDIDKDGRPDENLDAYGTGECNFNCKEESGIINPVDPQVNCSKNCDTDSDGWPDKNVDINNDGICDFNCDNDDATKDSDKDYYLDSEKENENTILDIGTNSDNNFYIINPLSIYDSDVEPGWEKKYILIIRNDTDYAVAYKIFWENVYNDFTDINNLDYFITRSNVGYLNNLKAPRNDVMLEQEALIKAKTTIRYVLTIGFTETGINQNIDSGKTFKGQLKIETIK